MPLNRPDPDAGGQMRLASAWAANKHRVVRGAQKGAGVQSRTRPSSTLA